MTKIEIKQVGQGFNMPGYRRCMKCNCGPKKGEAWIRMFGAAEDVLYVHRRCMETILFESDVEDEDVSNYKFQEYRLHLAITRGLTLG